MVSASSGVRTQERTEITRRSPSHGALCSTASDARAVAISTLATGRVCVSLSRLAGEEHTGRGGRVWTDVVLVDAPDFIRAGGCPGTFAEAVASAPLAAAKLGPSIEKVTLPATAANRRVCSRPAVVQGVRDGTLAAMAALLLERCSCVVAVADPVAALEGALMLLPLALRGELNVSAGLRFANSRRVTFCVVEQIDVDTRRATRGHPVALLAGDDLAGRSLGILGPWLELMMRWWSEERVGEAIALADSLQVGWSPREILEVAAVCEAIDRHEEDPERLEALLARRAAA